MNARAYITSSKGYNVFVVTCTCVLQVSTYHVFINCMLSIAHNLQAIIFVNFNSHYSQLTVSAALMEVKFSVISTVCSALSSSIISCSKESLLISFSSLSGNANDTRRTCKIQATMFAFAVKA